MSEQQFLSLVKQHQGIVHKICRLYRDSVQDREDLFQEIMFQLWQSFPAFEGRSTISSWMYRIALITALASFRKKSPAISFPERLPEIAAETPDDTEHQQRQQLLFALKQLDDVEKAIMALYLEDMSYAAIAAIIGISENYVGVKINRAKIKIQNSLNK